ncbi:MAG: hypothetical protein FWC19_06770 [Treponema sp.]|nr:hypothetical protein [Treponema sp.]MCL2272488.1 hypothetical protein [Treponema sp.]
MLITENDRMLLKFADVSEKDFENQSIEEQEKSLRKGMNKYLQARKNKKKPEYIENAKKELPKIIEKFQKKTLIYAKGVGVNTGIGIFLIVGYLEDKKKILVISPESKTEEVKIYRIDDNQIITSIDD